MNTNDDFENKRLIEEIENLENDSTEGAIKGSPIKQNKKIDLENIVFIFVIIVVVIAGIYVYFKNPKATEEMFEEYSKEAIGNDVSVEDISLIPTDSFSFFDFSEEYEENLSYEDFENLIKQKEDDFRKQKENLIVTEKILDVNKNLIACIENRNDVPLIDMEMYAVFFDGENNIIEVTSDYLDAIAANSKYYFNVNYTPENYEKCEIFITKRYFDDEEYIKLYNDKITFTDSIDNDRQIEIKATNNADEMIDYINFSVVYYDENDKILCVDNTSISELKKNKSDVTTVYGGWDIEKEEYINYDHYEVILNYAYTYTY